MRWFGKLRQSRPSTTPTPPSAVSAYQPEKFRQLQLKPATELVQIIELENLLRNIRRLAAIQEAHWQALYQPILDRFLESAQLAPASMAHHHAGPGGLAAHTLESVEIALQLRKPLVLPRNADPDTSARQEHVWTYALFVAVILHDLGKLSTTIRIRLLNGQYWTPYLRLDTLRSKTYQVEFATAPYKLHSRIANAALHLLPKAGMVWLSQHPDILAHVCAWLYGDYYEAGVIGELAQKADGESVARNLKNHGDRMRFPGAPAIPLVDRLITGLRQMLECNELKLNGNGADGWHDGHYLWLVCGTVAKKLVDYLRQEGMTQVPTDNNRIFDTLQEHGFIVPTDAGKAIWHTIVTGPAGNAFRFELTMLKFEVGRLLSPSRRPPAFEGTVTVSAVAPRVNTPANESSTATTICSTAAPVAPHMTAAAPVHSIHNPAAIEASAALHDWMQEDAVTESGTGVLPESAADMADLGTGQALDVSGMQKPTESAPAQNASVQLPVTGLLLFDDIRPRHVDDDTGQKFLDWLARMLRNNKLPINRQDAVIHMVKEGALVVSPRAFKEFIVFFDLFERENGTRLGTDDAAKHVQKKVEKLRQNIKNTTGMSVHTYQIVGPHRTSRISGFLFDPIILFGHITPPPANPLLAPPQASPTEGT